MKEVRSNDAGDRRVAGIHKIIILEQNRRGGEINDLEAARQECLKAARDIKAFGPIPPGTQERLLNFGINPQTLEPLSKP